jgi:membrane-bound ClpP family serine protease
MLAPPEGEERQERERRESLVDFQHLVGQRGIATTRLTPSGKARFGDESVDVITDGVAVAQGTPVVVTEVSGNRVVVDVLDNSSPSS